MRSVKRRYHMTLTEGISLIREKFQNQLQHGIAFARHDPGAGESQKTTIHRIVDVLVEPQDVLLLMESEPIRTADSHITVEELLTRLSLLPPECSEYSLEGCEPEVRLGEVTLRFDYPIITTGQVNGEDGSRLCLLIAIHQKRNDARKPWWKLWWRRLTTASSAA